MLHRKVLCAFPTLEPTCENGIVPSFQELWWKCCGTPAERNAPSKTFRERHNSSKEISMLLMMILYSQEDAGGFHENILTIVTCLVQATIIRTMSNENPGSAVQIDSNRLTSRTHNKKLILIFFVLNEYLSNSSLILQSKQSSAFIQALSASSIQQSSALFSISH
jgi:hypothetical protein